jgi:hypothetical protein
VKSKKTQKREVKKLTGMQIRIKFGVGKKEVKYVDVG